MTAEHSEPAPRPLLLDRGFVQLWLAGILSGGTRWLEMLAVGVFVYDVTGSPFQTALFTVLRLAPLPLLGLFGGALADRFPHRTIMAVSSLGMVATSALLLYLSWIGQLQLWHLGTGAVLSGVFWVVDMPTRRSMMGVVAGLQRVTRAMAIDSASGSATRAIGPLLGGIVLGYLGMDGVFLLSTLAYLAGVALFVACPYEEPQQNENREPVWQMIAKGLTIVRGSPPLQGVLVITIVFNLWGFPYTSMIPVIGRDILSLNATEVGLLGAAEGTCAFIGATFVAIFAREIYYKRIYSFGVLLCLSMILLTALSTFVVLTSGTILLAGIGAGFFGSMQSALIMLLSPPEARSRMLGILVVCIGVGPIGFLHLGLTADWFGTVAAMALMAVEGLAALAITWFFWPDIFRR